MSNVGRFLWIGVWVPLLSACAGAGPHWGADATLAPGWQPVGRAAVRAATDPLTWMPALGAIGLQIGQADEEIAEWANDDTPVFGSRDTAADASDWLRAASLGVYAGAGLFAPVAEGDFVGDKARGFAVGGSAVLATLLTTDALKAAGGRTRPLGQDDESFPSGHTSSASVGARLAHDALGYYDLADGARWGSDLGLGGLALATGWARVESGEHYPADALAGMALGNFFAVFAMETFRVAAHDTRVRVQAEPHANGMALQLSVNF